jgi:hypothetical protein
VSGGTNPFAKANRTDPSKDFTGIWPTLNQPTLFDWSRVDAAILKAAFQVAMVSGKTIGIGPAMGGRGVVVTLYMGLKTNPKRFAIDADELHPILLALVEAWGSPSEDVVASMRVGFSSSHPLEAD